MVNFAKLEIFNPYCHNNDLTNVMKNEKNEVMLLNIKNKVSLEKDGFQIFDHTCKICR